MAKSETATVAERSQHDAGHGERKRLLGMLGGQTSWGDFAAAIRYLVRPDQLVHGPAVLEYEEAFARYVGVRFAFSFSAARVALYELLRALGIGDGDEVLLQVPTHVVVANAIRYVGAIPRYVDCHTANYNMDLDLAEKYISRRTRAIILQHTFGIPADLDAARALSRKHNLILVEDCVHALGSEYDGRPVGSFGDAAFFSTEETKTISSTMGGMLTTNNEELATKLRLYQEICPWPPATLAARYVAKLASYHALMEPAIHPYSRQIYQRLGRRNPMPRAVSPAEFRGEKPAGYEQRLSNAQAALAHRQLRRIVANVSHRRAVSHIYHSVFAEFGLAGPAVPDRASPALLRYPLRVTDREPAIQAVSDLAMLGTWFSSVLSEAASPELVGYEYGSCPRAEAIAGCMVNLPTHTRVRAEDARRIATIVASTVGGIRP